LYEKHVWNKQPYEELLASVDQNPDYTPYDRLLAHLAFEPSLSKGSRRLICVLMGFYRKIKVGLPSISELAHESGYLERYVLKCLSKPATQKWVTRQPDGDFVFSFPKSELTQ
jgi:hypothetical protein